MLRPERLLEIDENHNNILMVILGNFIEHDNVFIGCIEYLIDKGVNINQKNNNNATPLSIVYNNQNFDVLKLLIEKNVNINININESPFIIELFKNFAAIINNRKKKILREIINLCFDKIIDVNIIDPSNGLTLLMIVYIVFRHDPYFNQYFDKIINTDLNIGADLNMKDHTGYTILMWTVESNDIRISQKLLSNPNININLKNNEGDTALDIALKAKNNEGYSVLDIDFINLLLDDDRLIKTSKLLNHAILSENISIVKLLINKNVPINNFNLRKYINSNNFNNKYKKEISNLLTKKNNNLLNKIK